VYWFAVVVLRLEAPQRVTMQRVATRDGGANLSSRSISPLPARLALPRLMSRVQVPSAAPIHASWIPEFGIVLTLGSAEAHA
jgi:hypothetical protein